VFWESKQYLNSTGQHFVKHQTGIGELHFLNIYLPKLTRLRRILLVNFMGFFKGWAQKQRVARFYGMARNICGCAALNLLHATLLAPRILR
jgi:hypothetical protein